MLLGDRLTIEARTLLENERGLLHESADRGGVGDRMAPLESDQCVDHLVGPILGFGLHLISDNLATGRFFKVDQILHMSKPNIQQELCIYIR